MTGRPDQKRYGFHAEAPYPDHRTVMVAFVDPDYVCHRATDICPIECGHRIEDCAEFDVQA